MSVDTDISNPWPALAQSQFHSLLPVWDTQVLFACAHQSPGVALSQIRSSLSCPLSFALHRTSQDSIPLGFQTLSNVVESDLELSAEHSCRSLIYVVTVLGLI